MPGSALGYDRAFTGGGMKIASITAAPVAPGGRLAPATSPRHTWHLGTDAGNTLGRYAEFTGKGDAIQPPWPAVACVARAEDGTWGLGMTSHAGPVVPIINDYFGPLATGQSVFATERIWDQMFRLSANFGASGFASYAMSAVDLALWDLKGKLLGRPVFELMGGPARDRIHCYATGHDYAWFMELGFDAIKLVLPFAEAGGAAALDAAEQVVAEARSAVGWERELMLDCWPASEVEFMVRVAERLRPYRLKWLEDFLTPEDYAGFDAMRARVPWQTLATGERWYTHLPFLAAAKTRCVDIFQPDVQWVGGVTAAQKIAAIADAAGIGLAMHGGVNDAYGQHVCYALPANVWGEIYVASAPGVPLEEGWRPTPGMALPKSGWLVPSDAPGFGIEMTQDELEAAVA
jgi:L-rhamnonate dehydratase